VKATYRFLLFVFFSISYIIIANPSFIHFLYIKLLWWAWKRKSKQFDSPAFATNYRRPHTNDHSKPNHSNWYIEHGNLSSSLVNRWTILGVSRIESVSVSHRIVSQKHKRFVRVDLLLIVFLPFKSFGADLDPLVNSIVTDIIKTVITNEYTYKKMEERLVPTLISILNQTLASLNNRYEQKDVSCLLTVKFCLKSYIFICFFFNPSFFYFQLVNFGFDHNYCEIE